MPDRYADTFPTDSPIVIDGDKQFVGMNSRLSPEKLEPGFAQFLGNIRLDTLTPTVRKGMAKQTNAVTFTLKPLEIPFVVGNNSYIWGDTYDGLMASCSFLDPNNQNKSYIFMVTAIQCYWIDANQNVGSILYPKGEYVESIDPSCDVFQDGGNVYILRGDLGTSFTVSSLTCSGTTATLTTTASHGLLDNQYVRIAGASPSVYNGDFPIAVTGLTTFSFTLTGTTSTAASGTIVCNRLKLPLKWAGNFASSFTLTSYGVISENFYYMPVSDWGLLQQNRAILEYGRNQIIMSQILGPEAYDIINGVFTFNAGSADFLVGACSYQDTQTLIFLRYSIYLINGTNGDVAAMTSQVVTNTVGCCSRHSIATCGCNVLFLSDQGVFMLQPGYELALRGNSLPLSAPINSFIQRINFAEVNAPFACYFLNRYYLAVPLDGAPRNTALLIYNFINQQWESVDTFPSGFYCDRMEVALNANGTPTLYLLSFEGGIYAHEQNEADDFAPSSQPAVQYPINGVVQTRRYTLGTTALKKFNRSVMNVNLDASSSITVTAATFNPEDSRLLSTVSTGATSQMVTRPMLINKRAYGTELTFTATTGRFVLNNLTVGAWVQDLKSTKTT